MAGNDPGHGSPVVASLPVADAHHHVWDLELKAHPWLTVSRWPPSATATIPRSGATICRPTIAATRRGSMWSRRSMSKPSGISAIPSARRAGCTRRPHARVCPTLWWRKPGSTAPMPRRCSPSRPRSRWCRSVRHKPKSAARPQDAKRGAPGSMDCPRWREGFALLARHRLHFDLQTPWWHLDAAAELARDFPATTIILNHTGLPADRSPEGLAGWRRPWSCWRINRTWR